jgi:hypothetical protein
VNSQTKETLWALPENIRAALQKVADEEKATPPKPPTLPLPNPLLTYPFSTTGIPIMGTTGIPFTSSVCFEGGNEYGRSFFPSSISSFNFNGGMNGGMIMGMGGERNVGEEEKEKEREREKEKERKRERRRRRKK